MNGSPKAVPRWRLDDPVTAARALLDRGGVLAIPTESSYGLAADPRSAEGIARIFGLKGRDAAQALPVVAAERRQIDALGLDTGLLDRPDLAPVVGRFWPGPLSVALPLRPGAPPLHGRAPDGTVAVRIPGHDGLRRWLARCGRALTATSANRSGEAPALDTDTVSGLLAALPAGAAAILDGGSLAGGAPSTLVRVREDRIEVVREGAIAAGAIASAAAGRPVADVGSREGAREA